MGNKASANGISGVAAVGRNPAGRSQSSIFSDPCSASPALASPAPRDVLSEGRVSARMSIMVPDTCSPLPEVVDSLPRDSLCHWRLKKGTKLISESATSEVLLSPTFLDCTEDVCLALPCLALPADDLHGSHGHGDGQDPGPFPGSKCCTNRSARGCPWGRADVGAHPT